MVERHPLESQAFIPLQNQSWLLVVGMPGDEPDVSIWRTFRATGRQGVNYHRGVWHHPLLVLKQDQDFLVVDRGGPGENCDEVWFDGASARIVVQHSGPKAQSAAVNQEIGDQRQDCGDPGGNAGLQP